MRRPQRNPEAYPPPVHQLEVAQTAVGKSDYPRRTAARRHELTQLALEACKLFDKYHVLPHEKCYVGRLCQTLLEF